MQKPVQQVFCFGRDRNEGIGISSYPRDAQDAEQLIINADDAMYEVKKSGKNNFAFYHAQNQK